MVMYNSGDLKSGLKVLIDGEPYNIVESDFHKPGKGQAGCREINEETLYDAKPH